MRETSSPLHSSTSPSLYLYVPKILPPNKLHRGPTDGSRSHHFDDFSSRSELPKRRKDANKLYKGVLKYNNRYFILDTELKKTELELLPLLRLSSAIEKSIASGEALEEDIKTQLKKKQEKLKLEIDETKGKLTELKSERYTALKEASQLFKPYSPHEQTTSSTEKKYEILLWVRGDIPMQYIEIKELQEGGTLSKFTKSWHEGFAMAFSILCKKFKDKETEKSPTCLPFFNISFGKPFANKKVTQKSAEEEENKVTQKSVEEAIQSAEEKENEFKENFETSNIKEHFADPQEYAEFRKCYFVYKALGGKLSEKEYLEKQEMAEFISLCLIEKIQEAENEMGQNPDSPNPIIICIQEGNDLLWNAIAPKIEAFAFQTPREILIRQIDENGSAVGDDTPLKRYPIFTGNRQWYSGRFNICPLSRELDSDAAKFVFGENENSIIFPNLNGFQRLRILLSKKRKDQAEQDPSSTPPSTSLQVVACARREGEGVGMFSL